MDRTIEGLEFLLKKPYRFLFCVFGLFLFFGLISLHSSFLVKDYIQTTGEICNVEQVRVLWHQQYVMRYNYDLIWYDNGTQYEKHIDEQMDCPEEGEVTIWVRPDNRDAALYNSVEIKGYVGLYLGISLLAGVVGLVLFIRHITNRKETREEREERLENTEIGSMLLFILCLIGIAIQGIYAYMDYRKELYVNPVWFDFSIACGIIAIICLILFFRAKRQLNS